MSRQTSLHPFRKVLGSSPFHPPSPAPHVRIRVEEILKHPYLAPPPIRRGFPFRTPADPGHDLRAEMQHRYQLAMASKRLCTLTSSSRGTTDTSTGNSSSGSPLRGSSRGPAGGVQATAAGRTQGRHNPFDVSVYRGKEDGEEFVLPVMGIEEASRVTGGFMANGQPSVIMNALHRELFDMEAQVCVYVRAGWGGLWFCCAGKVWHLLS